MGAGVEEQASSGSRIAMQVPHAFNLAQHPCVITREVGSWQQEGRGERDSDHTPSGEQEQAALLEDCLEQGQAWSC